MRKSEDPRRSARRGLFASAFAPALAGGRALRMYGIVQALAALGPLDLLYAPFPVEEPSPEYASLTGVTYERVRPSRGASRAIHYGAMRLAGRPDGIARSSSREFVAAATRLADVPGRGLIMAGDIGTAVALRGLARRHPVVYVAHNVECSFDSSADRSRLETAALRRTERQVLTRAAECWMATPRDMELARELAPAARLRYVPNVVDVQGITPVPAGPPNPTILVVADYSYTPNVAGAEWLVQAVMPWVWQRRPDAELLLVGRGSERIAGAEDPRVLRPGFVADLRDVYERAGVVAVPLTSGGGSPLKLVEALAHQVPVVATPVATRGTEALAGEHLREASTPEAFAGALVDVLRHGDPNMAEHARDLVARRYSVQTLEESLAGPVAGRLGEQV